MSSIHSPVRVMLRTAALASFLASWLGAQMPAERVPADPAWPAAEPSKNGTFGIPFTISGGSSTLENVDGELLAIGDDYKAVLDEHGILFTPALGRSVPTNQALRLQLVSMLYSFGPASRRQ